MYESRHESAIKAYSSDGPSWHSMLLFALSYFTWWKDRLLKSKLYKLTYPQLEGNSSKYRMYTIKKYDYIQVFLMLRLLFVSGMKMANRSLSTWGICTTLCMRMVLLFRKQLIFLPYHMWEQRPRNQRQRRKQMPHHGVKFLQRKLGDQEGWHAPLISTKKLENFHFPKYDQYARQWHQ